ncbi:PREDICTED: uncharacterized protein LOC106807224 [Priapulus caudatus]|uniref:Uncharacterized protein LOC106807224 n=1 Tax=Priapulus caudatus TaxID=37621 RepID=A0ABM1DYH6_PRICU|nr:PREDICTED: uncharacterized protein LOC106807224 [Priapulus caudatus]
MRGNEDTYEDRRRSGFVQTHERDWDANRCEYTDAGPDELQQQQRWEEDSPRESQHHGDRFPDDRRGGRRDGGKREGKTRWGVWDAHDGSATRDRSQGNPESSSRWKPQDGGSRQMPAKSRGLLPKPGLLPPPGREQRRSSSWDRRAASSPSEDWEKRDRSRGKESSRERSRQDRGQRRSDSRERPPPRHTPEPLGGATPRVSHEVMDLAGQIQVAMTTGNAAALGELQKKLNAITSKIQTVTARDAKGTGAALMSAVLNQLQGGGGGSFHDAEHAGYGRRKQQKQGFGKPSDAKQGASYPGTQGGGQGYSATQEYHTSYPAMQGNQSYLESQNQQSYSAGNQAYTGAQQHEGSAAVFQHYPAVQNRKATQSYPARGYSMEQGDGATAHDYGHRDAADVGRHGQQRATRSPSSSSSLLGSTPLKPSLPLLGLTPASAGFLSAGGLALDRNVSGGGSQSGAFDWLKHDDGSIPGLGSGCDTSSRPAPFPFLQKAPPLHRRPVPPTVPPPKQAPFMATGKKGGAWQPATSGGEQQLPSLMRQKMRAPYPRH